MKLFADMERKRRELAERDQEERKRKREAEIEDEENQKLQKEWQKNFEVQTVHLPFGFMEICDCSCCRSRGKIG